MDDDINTSANELHKVERAIELLAQSNRQLVARIEALEACAVLDLFEDTGAVS